MSAAQYARFVVIDQRSAGSSPIDPRDPSFFLRDDYFGGLAHLRDDDPVHLVEPGFWVVTRYADIRDLSRDPAAFCSGRGALVNDPLRSDPTGEAGASRSILHMDPPEHATFRSLVNRRFTPRALAGLGPSIRKTAPRLLGGVDPPP